MKLESRKSDEFFTRSMELVKFYRENPAIAASDLLNVDLPECQRLVLKDMWSKSFVLVTAARGFGKCISGDSLVPTSSGLVQIDSLGSQLNPLSELNLDIVDRYGAKDSTSKWYYDGFQEVFTIETRYGYKITGTSNHPILVMDSSGNYVWRLLPDIDEGDTIPICRNVDIFNTENQCSSEEAEFLGLLVGDGCFRGHKGSLSFTVGDEDVLNRYVYLFKNIFPEYMSLNVRDKYEGVWEVKSWSTKIWSYLEKLGLKNNILSGDKDIPASVLKSSSAIMAAFLRGLFETDGGCEANKVSYCTKSNKLSKQVHSLLLYFGIVSRLRKKSVKYKGEVRYYNVIEIMSSDIDLFREKIGFISERKKELLNDLCKVTRNPNVDVIPNLQKLFLSLRDNVFGIVSCDVKKESKVYAYSRGEYDPSFKSLERILKWYPFKDNIYSVLKEIVDRKYFHDKVTKVSKSWDHCYDFVVPKTNSFVANGIINHNSFLLSVISVLYAMLYPGKRVLIMSPSFRQCVVGNSLVMTENGFEYAEDVNESDFLFSSSGFKRKEVKYKNLPEPTIKISTECGFSIEGAHDHRILMVNNGRPGFSSLQDITVGDWLFIKKDTQVFGNVCDLSSYISDMSFCLGNTRKASLPAVLDETFSCFLGKQLLDSLGIGGKLAKDKCIPKIILQTNKENQTAFIRGLFDTDGCVYFNKDTTHKYKLNIGLTSKAIIRDLQILLLNLGIVSSIGINSSGDRKNPLYVLEVSDVQSVLKFAEQIGFSHPGKAEKLNEVVGFILNSSYLKYDNIPAFIEIKLLVECIRTFGVPFEKLRIWEWFTKEGEFKKEYVSRGFIKRCLEFCSVNGIIGLEVLGCNRILNSGFIFKKVKEISSGFDYTYDFTVEKVHNYISNGFVSHNSKNVFGEVKRRYLESPILRECTEKRPIVSSDRCYLTFRSVDNKPGSMVEAYPLGTGDKIRGLRGHLIVADEFSKIPEDIYNMVIRPMGATTSSPMEKVRRLERLQRQFDLGLLSNEEFADRRDEEGGANKIVGVSSAWYQFNHMYAKIKVYQNFIENGSLKHATHFYSYHDVPAGFMDSDNIKESKATMSRVEFNIEYMGIWESDSDGVFRASLLESCKTRECLILPRGIEGKKYVLGVDPARSRDAFALVIIEIGSPSFTVYAKKIQNMKFPEMARTIYDLTKKFNVVSVEMDAGSGGGGVALKDILAGDAFGDDRILDADDEEYKHESGRKILHMFDPKPKTIAEANYNSLNLLEHGRLKFPLPPLWGGEAGSDEKERIYEDIDEMLSQMMLITVSQTKTGLAHFDIPVTGKEARQKDLYSAFILAGKALYDLVYDRPDATSAIHKLDFVVMERDPVSAYKSISPSIVKNHPTGRRR